MRGGSRTTRPVHRGAKRAAGATRRSANKPEGVRAKTKQHVTLLFEGVDVSKLAERILAAVLKKVSSLPGIENAPQLSGRERQSISPAGSVPDEFLEAVIDAVKAHPELTGASQFDVKKTKQTIAQTKPYREVTDGLEAVIQRVLDYTAQQRHKAGSAALMVYANGKELITRGVAKPGVDNHVEKMRKALGRTGARTRKPEPTPPTPPK